MQSARGPFFFKQWGGVRKATTGRDWMAELTTSTRHCFDCRAVVLKSSRFAGKTCLRLAHKERESSMNFDEIGPWSEIKLDILRDYAAPYSTILKSNGFPHGYIDAFSGPGLHVRKTGGEEAREARWWPWPFSRHLTKTISSTSMVRRSIF